jgi:hypothetical protein
VSRPHIALYPRTPLALRLFDRATPNSLWVGVGIGGALFVIFLLYTWLFGAAPGTLADVRAQHAWIAELLEDLFFGFTLAIAAASVRGAVRDLDALLPTLEAAAADRAALRAEVLTYHPLPVALVATAMALFSGITTPLDPSLWVDGRFPGFSHPTAIWLAVRNFLNWWAVGFAMTLELMLAWRFSRLGDHLTTIDLLERARLAPFARRALRNVALWMVLAAFLSLLYAGADLAGALLPFGLLCLTTFAAAAFLLPLWGAHRRLAACKEVELSRVRAALLSTREAVLAPAAAKDQTGGRLADLLAYEARVSEAREWPIDTSTVLRFAFYMTLGLGSWVGAGVVQHVIEKTLR